MKLILTAIFFVLVTSAFSQDGWTLVSTSNDGAKYFVKDTYVSKDYDGIKIWIRVNSPTITIKKKAYKNVKQMQLWVIDCEGNRMKLTTFIRYTSNGQVIDNTKLAEYEQVWTDIVPETVSEQLLTHICSNVKD